MNLLPLVPVTLASLCPALAAQRSERRIDEDMAFARELAARYQYVDLAESVLARLEKESLTPKLREGLSLVQCQIYTESAKREGDPKKRLGLFDKAAGAYKQFFDRHAGSEKLREAELSYLDLVTNYGRALELALADAVGEEALRLRAVTKTVLDEGLKRTSELKDTFDKPDLTPAQRFEKWRLMLDRAELLITLGNVSPDPMFPHRQAENELERVASEATETSGFGLNAFLGLARLKRAQGRFREAAEFAEFVVQTAMPVDPELPEWRELPFEVKAERFRLVELGIPDLVDSHAAAGNMPAACTWSLYMYNAWKREGFPLSPLGYLALLSAARTLLDAGGFVGGSMSQGMLRWFETEEEMTKAGATGRDARSALDLALLTAQEVNAANKGNTLQARAQKLISDVISRPGLSVSPDVLFEAAQGEYNTKNYARAIGSFKGLMRALDGRDEATRRAFAPRAFYFTGQSFSQLQRPLEAAMSYREGATTYGGDPEYQERLARGFYARMGELRKAAAGDALVERLFLQAEDLVQKASTGASDITWRQAERAYEQKDFAGAYRSYLEVKEGADEYEKALVKAALCLYKQKDLEGARREFRLYLREFVPDPKHAITGARKVAAREEARAQGTYYLGQMAFDAQDHDQVVEVFTGYEVDFASQTDYAPNALFMLVSAHLARRDLDGARRTQAKLQELFGTHPSTGKSAMNLFQALKAEQEAALEAGDGERSTALRREMARNMRVSNQTTGEPAFQNLRLEATLWLELEEWAAAEQVLRSTLQLFQDQAERAGDLEKFVWPDLGVALLGQKRVPEAFQALDPLVPKDDADTRRPSSGVVRNWCRSVSGWLEGEGPRYVEVPGVGGAANFGRAVQLLGKLVEAERNSSEDGRGAWTCPWYRLKFEQMFALLRWGDEDSSQRPAARRLLEDMSSQLGDEDLKEVAKSCGDELLRKRFLWVRGQTL